MYTPDEIAAVYALDKAPRIPMASSTLVGWNWGPSRIYREWRVFTIKGKRERSSTQLDLFTEES